MHMAEWLKEAVLAGKAVVVPDFRVELSWQADPRNTATVKGYKVFRWDEGADFPAKPLSEDLVEGTSFVDENPEQLLPLKKYSYSVRAVTEEEVKTPGGKEPGSAPVNVSMPDDRQGSRWPSLWAIKPG